VGDTIFSGYSQLLGDARVAAILVGGKPTDAAAAGQAAEIVLDRSPFYAESGGQVGDRGVLSISGSGTTFLVSDVQKAGGGRLFAHAGIVQGGELRVGSVVSAAVDASLRRRVRQMHANCEIRHSPPT